MEVVRANTRVADVVNLPLVEHTATVAAALKRMGRARAGIVVKWPDDAHSLVLAGALLRARDAGVELVSGVPGVHLVTPHRSNTRARQIADQIGLMEVFDKTKDQIARSVYTQLFRKIGYDYAIAGSSNRMARVITGSPRVAAMLNMSGGYQCTGTPRHYFPDPFVEVDDPCPEVPLCGKDSVIVPAE